MKLFHPAFNLFAISSYFTIAVYAAGSPNINDIIGDITDTVNAELAKMTANFDVVIADLNKDLANLSADGAKLDVNFSKLKQGHQIEVDMFVEEMAAYEEVQKARLVTTPSPATGFSGVDDGGLPDIANCMAGAIADYSWYEVTAGNDIRHWKHFYGSMSRPSAENKCTDLGVGARLAQLLDYTMKAEMLSYLMSNLNSYDDVWIGYNYDHTYCSTSSQQYESTSNRCCVAMDGDEDPWKASCSSYYPYYVCEVTCSGGV